MRKAFVPLLAYIFAGIGPAYAGDKALSSAFEIAPAPYAIERGIPARLMAPAPETSVVTLEESPSSRWDPSWGSYPAYVAEVLHMLGDANAAYLGHGRVRVSFGPRKVLIDTLQRFSRELEMRGLRLQIQMLSRDMSTNGHVHGDTNSDHLIGFAADGKVIVAPCSKGTVCGERRELADNPLEVQMRIMMAAALSGAQQVNMYGLFSDAVGQHIHIGVSPFRNGSVGEMLGSARADGTRRIGYGSAQKGAIGTLSKDARRYVGYDGTSFHVVFLNLLHNPPPQGYEMLYNAIRERNLDWIGDVMD